jgi:hypothetical protein
VLARDSTLAQGARTTSRRGRYVCGAVDVENENQNCFYVAKIQHVVVVNNGHILALLRLKSSDSTYIYVWNL